MQLGELPSSRHARELLQEPNASAVATVAVDVLGRAALIALGLELARPRRRKELVEDALFASLVIEAFVLFHTASTP